MNKRCLILNRQSFQAYRLHLQSQKPLQKNAAAFLPDSVPRFYYEFDLSVRPIRKTDKLKDSLSKQRLLLSTGHEGFSCLLFLIQYARNGFRAENEIMECPLSPE